MKRCHSCKKELSVVRGVVARKDVCPSCGHDLHCCLNCRHYDPAVSKQCRETIAELVKEKAKANFCDYFSLAEAESASASDAAEQARKSLEELFRK